MMTSLVVVRCVTGRRVWSRWRGCQWLTGRYETASDWQVDVCGQDDEAASDWQVDWYGKYADETASDWQVDTRLPVIDRSTVRVIDSLVSH